MSDLIERQAAIDALNDVSKHYTDKGREWHPHVNFMVDAIKELPSAQPEIIQCEDCKHHSHDAGYGYDWCDRTSGVFRVKPEDFCSRAERRTG